ncbi:hypothetical protein Lgra_1364 [Legionella gratiana]|uniref:Uncharacterized conserved protein n=1 Tax=Legionella gratiana TaxID=45066 RepID=A0A378JFD7_9GAMM|nr:PDDEXK nuclease domain-containing protein [Legionella gratiana]KTD11906.1 hypothetical protein Lgra_1364 [Legionella gratiana]STX46502.1 Uncharacterized conserved protein [Legionella gratiana]
MAAYADREWIERQAITSNKTSNYHKHLPELQSDLANEILKDPYNFDFLTIQGKVHERSIENALITHIRDFLIELNLLHILSIANKTGSNYFFCRRRRY